MKRHKIPDEFQSLTDDQLAQVHTWLEDHIYVDVLPKLQATFGIKMSKSKLARYNAKRELAQDLSDGALDAQDLCDIFNGQPVKFGQAGILLLQKRAFDLAHDPKNSASKLNSLLRVLSYDQQLELNQRRVKTAEITAEARLRTAEAAVLRAFVATEKQTKKPSGKPGENPGDVDPETEQANDPVARVIQHCGSVAHFFKKMLPGERIMHAVERLHKEIEAGRLPWRPWDDEDEPLTEDERTGVFRMTPEEEAWVARMKAEREGKMLETGETDEPTACTPEEALCGLDGEGI